MITISSSLGLDIMRSYVLKKSTQARKKKKSLKGKMLNIWRFHRNLKIERLAMMKKRLIILRTYQ